MKIYSDQENSLGKYKDQHLKNRRLHPVEVSKVVFPDHVSVETVQKLVIVPALSDSEQLWECPGT